MQLKTECDETIFVGVLLSVISLFKIVHLLFCRSASLVTLVTVDSVYLLPYLFDIDTKYEIPTKASSVLKPVKKGKLIV